MSPWAIWAIQEALKITIQRLEGMGSLDSITEEQAKAEIAKMTAELPGKLPSPSDLEGDIPKE